MRHGEPDKFSLLSIHTQTSKRMHKEYTRQTRVPQHVFAIKYSYPIQQTTTQNLANIIYGVYLPKRVDKTRGAWHVCTIQTHLLPSICQLTKPRLVPAQNLKRVNISEICNPLLNSRELVYLYIRLRSKLLLGYIDSIYMIQITADASKHVYCNDTESQLISCLLVG